jgi:hypothetical protein
MKIVHAVQKQKGGEIQHADPISLPLFHLREENILKSKREVDNLMTLRNKLFIQGHYFI